jgi:hypothetical protein
MVRKIGTPEDEAKNAETLRELEASVIQAKPSIHTKIVAVMGAITGDMKPEGRNPHFNYRHWTTDQITGFFRGQFVRQGLSFMADVVDFDVQKGETAKGGKTWLTTIKVLFSVTDTVTGEVVSGHGIGQGDDPGDKGSNKAFAGALKYWFLKTFLVGGEDAEADESTDVRSEPRQETRREARDVVIGDSNIEGIERGGRSTNATDIQVRRVRNLARDLRYGADATNTLIADILDRPPVDLPGDPDERGPALVKFLEGLSADDIGKVITYMEAMASPEETDEPGSTYP